MEDPIPCQLCGRPAQLRLVRPDGGLNLCMELCPACAQRCDPSAEDPLAELLEQSHAWASLAAKTCSGCGMGWKEFFRSRRIGCSRCLEEFLPPEQRDAPHLPTARPQGEELPDTIPAEARGYVFNLSFAGFASYDGDALSLLKSQLKRAVRREQFETAAVLRDRIRQLEQEHP
ncbi:MAG: UvrB/UvrC motif-containing protein [Puniceicoccales bacterium]|jgi:protein arginine kinase activator|nr:UvrB/UvrC motif-containing protein [Puniceicoccales bacterium]